MPYNAIYSYVHFFVLYSGILKFSIFFVKGCLLSVLGIGNRERNVNVFFMSF